MPQILRRYENRLCNAISENVGGFHTRRASIRKKFPRSNKSDMIDLLTVTSQSACLTAVVSHIKVCKGV